MKEKERCPCCDSSDIMSAIKLVGYIRELDGTFHDEQVDKKLRTRECYACGHHWTSTLQTVEEEDM